EDRLTAALKARAELVQPEGLQHVTPPEPASSRWRRPVVVALIAAACLAVAVPLVRMDKGDDDGPTVHIPMPPTKEVLPQGPFTAPEPKLTDQLTGDVDGDGRPDHITASGNTITVTLAADPAHPVTWKDHDLQGLVGLVDTGGGTQGIVESTHDQVTGNS